METFAIPSHYVPADTLLAGKTILVTGAGDGIGRAAALAYADAGATVLLLGRTGSKLEQVYDAIEAAGAPRAAIIELDLETATEEDCARLAGELSAAFGHLDGLLHNAGILGERRPIESATYSEWQRVMQVNLNGAFLLTRYLLPLLQAAPMASLVFTSSGVGRKGKAFWGAYAVSKFATEGLVQVLASELENTSKVRVNCINPGPTNTAMRRSAYPAETPDTNPGPQAIMHAYLYLMGDDSAAENGKSFDAQ